jgi:hypothetical protein
VVQYGFLLHFDTDNCLLKKCHYSIVVIDDAPNVSEPGLNIGGDIIKLVGDIEAEGSDNEDVQTYY